MAVSIAHHVVGQQLPAQVFALRLQTLSRDVVTLGTPRPLGGGRTFRGWQAREPIGVLDVAAGDALLADVPMPG